MQTCRQSRLEVGADFGVSLVVNLVTQVLFFRNLACTPGRAAPDGPSLSSELS